MTQDDESEVAETATNEQLEVVIGYGTFITKWMFRGKQNVRTVTVKGYRRVFKKGVTWFPFVIPDENAEVKTLAFKVSKNDLKGMDGYEGYYHEPNDLYTRIKVQMVEDDGTDGEAWIYVPTDMTIERAHIDSSWTDEWIDVIKQDKEIVKRFPALLE